MKFCQSPFESMNIDMIYYEGSQITQLKYNTSLLDKTPMVYYKGIYIVEFQSNCLGVFATSLEPGTIKDLLDHLYKLRCSCFHFQIQNYNQIIYFITPTFINDL